MNALRKIHRSSSYALSIRPVRLFRIGRNSAPLSSAPWHASGPRPPPAASPLMVGRLSRLHSFCLVDRCGRRRCSQEIDQRLSRQRLLGEGWRNPPLYAKSGLCRSAGNRPTTSMPGTSISSLIGCIPISASPRGRPRQLAASFSRRATKRGESSISARRRCQGFPDLRQEDAAGAAARWVDICDRFGME